MEIKRDSYLQQLISYRFDGLVKVITGIRRCGKSYLLKKIYRDYCFKTVQRRDRLLRLSLTLQKTLNTGIRLHFRRMSERKWREARKNIIFLLMRYKCPMR